MDAPQIIIAIVAPVVSLSLGAAGWSLSRAVVMLLQHDRDIAVIKTRLGLEARHVG
jgi:hypothetical protein